MRKMLWFCRQVHFDLKRRLGFVEETWVAWLSVLMPESSWPELGVRVSPREAEGLGLAPRQLCPVGRFRGRTALPRQEWTGPFH